MSTHAHITKIAVTAVAALAGSLLLAGSASADVKALTPPAIPGVAALPGDGEFLLTGKGWRSMYHVRLAADRPRQQPARLLAG